MEWKITIFNSQAEFRNYVIVNSMHISKLYVFEDVPDKVIYFYCFFKNGAIIATTEVLDNNFSSYRKCYLCLAKKLHLHIAYDRSKPNALCIIG